MHNFFKKLSFVSASIPQRQHGTWISPDPFAHPSTLWCSRAWVQSRCLYGIFLFVLLLWGWLASPPWWLLKGQNGGAGSLHGDMLILFGRLGALACSCLKKWSFLTQNPHLSDYNSTQVYYTVWGFAQRFFFYWSFWLAQDLTKNNTTTPWTLHETCIIGHGCQIKYCGPS